MHEGEVVNVCKFKSYCTAYIIVGFGDMTHTNTTCFNLLSILPSTRLATVVFSGDSGGLLVTGTIVMEESSRAALSSGVVRAASASGSVDSVGARFSTVDMARLSMELDEVVPAPKDRNEVPAVVPIQL